MQHISRRRLRENAEAEKRFKRQRHIAFYLHEKGFMGGKPSKYVCLECRKAGHLPSMCCGRHPYYLGYNLRAPRSGANEKVWRKFETLLFETWPYNKTLRVKNVTLVNESL